jgi:2-dehydro-3-deoxyphosphogluconate aldolase/(4S)-4-hydroxy-2-oxoglutarate aldolase
MGPVERLRRERLVAVLRCVPDLDRVAAELAGAGVGVLEVTLDDDGALGAIARLRARGDVSVLAGTVRTVEQAEAAADAGAEALVSPVFSGAVLARGHQLGLPVIPGALTPTEMEAAWRAGAAMVKLFPARLGGPQYVADVLKPLPDLPLLCTGGVTAADAAAYLAAGAAAVGVSFRGDVTVTASAVLAATRVHDPAA